MKDIEFLIINNSWRNSSREITIKFGDENSIGKIHLISTSILLIICFITIFIFIFDSVFEYSKSIDHFRRKIFIIVMNFELLLSAFSFFIFFVLILFNMINVSDYNVHTFTKTLSISISLIGLITSGILIYNLKIVLESVTNGASLEINSIRSRINAIALMKKLRSSISIVEFSGTIGIASIIIYIFNASI